MRIGLVTDFYYPWIGGPATFIRNLGHGLAARGHSIFLLAPSDTGEARNKSDGLMEVQRVRTLPVPFGFHMRMASQPLLDAERWLERVRPDVVHVHHPFPLSAGVVWLARQRNIPVIATNHTIPECSLWGMRETPAYEPVARVLGWWIRFVLTNCDAVSTPTRTAADLLHDLGFGRPVVSISNGVDTRRFAPGAYPASLAHALGVDGRRVVLYTGRLDAEKHMDVWLGAAARMSSVANVHFLIGGKGTDRDRLERLSVSLGIGDRVTFFGYLPEVDYPAIYRLADVFCISSPVELQSIATLEAISSGLPAVAVRAGALPEIVRHDHNGLTVERGDDAAMSDALVRILDEPDTRRRMGYASRELALTHDLSRTVEKYEMLMVDTLATARAA